MKITEATFITSVFKPGALPEPTLPEIAFSGRSNVGKSSLINTLVRHRKLAKTSSTPGRTQSINFFRVNRQLYFVDLPGYGYARVPLTVKRSWRDLIEGYLMQRDTLRLVILLADARRDPHGDEAGLAQWLAQHEIPCTVVLTKVDKLKRNARQRASQAWQRYLGVDSSIAFSAVTGEGRDEIWRAIQAAAHLPT